MEAMDTELVWAAGLMVGDGTTHLRKNSGGRAPCAALAVAMQDERAVARFARAITPYLPLRAVSGGWSKQDLPPPSAKVFKKSNGKTYYQCMLTGNRAVAAAQALYPWLQGTDKGDQMRKVLAALGHDVEEHSGR